MRRALYKHILKFSLAWLLPGALFLTMSQPEFQWGAHHLTLKNLQLLRAQTKKYLDKFPASHPSLREIAEYSRRLAQPLSIYDQYGMRFDLRSLDDHHHIVKSWAPMLFRDPDHELAQGLFAASSRWSKLFPVVIHSYPEPPALYQPAQLISSTSFDQSLTARLFVNHKSGHRTLVVVNSDNYDPVFIHDTLQPEEFFWLPGRRILIFTSDPQHSMKGPLHFYDADHDEVRTITMASAANAALTDHKQPAVLKAYMAALAGAKDNRVYAYVMPHSHEPVRASELFAVKNLYEILVTFPRGSQARFQAHMSPVQPNERQSYHLKHTYSMPKLGRGETTQRMWFRLKIIGNIEGNIEQWQSFALMAQNRHSPMLPYALMTLITLYDRVGRLYASHNKAQGAELHQYALGYAKLVAQGSSYPTWLNLVAWDVWQRLQEGGEINLSGITPLSQQLRVP